MSKTTKATEAKATETTYTLEQYAQRFKANPGTIASFKYEAVKSGDKLDPRSKAEWDSDIEKQKKKVYK